MLSLLQEYSTLVLSLQLSTVDKVSPTNLPPSPQPNGQKQRSGTASYANGQATATSILDGAKALVIEEGFAKLSMRGLARSLGMSPGNLNYYYSSKSDLIQDLCAFVVEPYLQEFEKLRLRSAASASNQLRSVLEFVYNDLGNRETTLFFPELWVLALRDSGAAEHMDSLYSSYRSVIQDIIQDTRPDLDQQTTEDLALSISASIEGHTVFVGHRRSHADRAGPIGELIIEQLIEMVERAPARQQYV